MATNVNIVAGPRTALTVTGLASLASANYVASSVKDNTASKPMDVMVEVTVGASAATTGNKQVVVFAQASFDNVNWQSGPTSGAANVDELNLTFVGTVPLLSTAAQRMSFSVATAYAGNLPPYFRLVFKNDCGVTLNAGAVSTIEYAAQLV